jgi:hypothetical protein
MAIVLNGTTGITNDGGYTGDGVVFADTTPANTLVTDTSGNVGIGIASPSQRLHIAKNGTLGIRLDNQATNYWDIENNSNLLFSRGGTEYARIDSSGNLLVGLTTSNPVANRVNGYAFNAGGTGGWRNTVALNVGFGATSGAHFQFYTDNGTTFVGAGQISSNGSTSTYSTSSDYRMKEKVVPMIGALSTVMKLRPVTFKWKSEFAGTNNQGQGFIAHELQAIVPDAVTGQKDAVDAEGKPQYQGIDTSFLVATLTAAIQEQQALIQSLTDRITALETA